MNWERDKGVGVWRTLIMSEMRNRVIKVTTIKLKGQGHDIWRLV